jgi:3-dehydroquinate synthase
MHRIALPSYAVSVAPGALDGLGELVRDAAPAHRYALITDETVARHHAPRAVAALGGRRVDTLVIPPGEAHKTRETWASLTDRMIGAGFGRDAAIIAMGGGVVGDLAGFVAATFMRGIPVVQVPTTLLAMIDASIGGKTGVDTPAGKNLVGAFHQPAAVVVDPELLATLPPNHLRAGLAEAIKHGIIADESHFDEIARAIPRLLGGAPDAAMLTPLIAHSIDIKASVVRRDERESGVRAVLNFGHTLGHAIEMLSGYRLLHGEAVSIGMTLESAAGERAGIAEPGTSGRVRDLLVRAGLPVDRPRAIPADDILSAAHGDKKARAGATRYALPRRVGAMAGEREGWSIPLEDSLVREVLS